MTTFPIALRRRSLLVGLGACEALSPSRSLWWSGVACPYRASTVPNAVTLTYASAWRGAPPHRNKQLSARLGCLPCSAGYTRRTGLEPLITTYLASQPGWAVRGQSKEYSA